MTDYNGLLKAAHAAEIDSQKNTVVRAKAAIKKTPKDDASDGNNVAEPKLKDVAKELDQLLGIVKANQVKKKEKSKSLPATPRKIREQEITAMGIINRSNVGVVGDGVIPVEIVQVRET